MEQGTGHSYRQSYGKCTEHASFFPGLSPACNGEKTNQADESPLVPVQSAGSQKNQKELCFNFIFRYVSTKETFNATEKTIVVPGMTIQFFAAHNTIDSLRGGVIPTSLTDFHTMITCFSGISVTPWRQ
jgi:hypothetical protein